MLTGRGSTPVGVGTGVPSTSTSGRSLAGRLMQTYGMGGPLGPASSAHGFAFLGGPGTSPGPLTSRSDHSSGAQGLQRLGSTGVSKEWQNGARGGSRGGPAFGRGGAGGDRDRRSQQPGLIDIPVIVTNGPVIVSTTGRMSSGLSDDGNEGVTGGASDGEGVGHTSGMWAGHTGGSHLHGEPQDQHVPAHVGAEYDVGLSSSGASGRRGQGQGNTAGSNMGSPTRIPHQHTHQPGSLQGAGGSGSSGGHLRPSSAARAAMPGLVINVGNASAGQ
jgi:hypothetical protein